MEPTVPELLRQGLIMTVLGMGLVFAALFLLWGVMALLTRVFRDPTEFPEGRDGVTPDEGRVVAPAQAEATAVEALTAERARVAAIAAGALIANAVPLHLEVPLGPVFEHGRTAPIWVSANRARVLQPWQPQRAAETQPRISED